jgi:plastocyanin
MRRLGPLVLALVLLAACGGDDDADGGSASGGGEVVDVGLSDFTIDPSGIDVEPGSYTFHVVNDGATVHALEVEGPNGEVETEELAPGESADLVVELQEDGEFEMYCPVGDHRSRGMEGTIAVGAGAAPGGGGTTTDETTTEDSDYRY